LCSFRDNLKISSNLVDFDFTSTTTLQAVSCLGQLSTFDLFSGDLLSASRPLVKKPTPYTLHALSTHAYPLSALLLSPTKLQLCIPDGLADPLYYEATTHLSKFTCLCLESGTLDYGLPKITA
jgi:hypothetical protein